MATITYDMPPGTFSALRLSPKEFAREMRIAACVQWYAQGRVSQGKAAEIAGLSRAEFLEELFRRKVSACQVTYEELIEEIEHDGEVPPRKAGASLGRGGRLVREMRDRATAGLTSQEVMVLPRGEPGHHHRP